MERLLENLQQLCSSADLATIMAPYSLKSKTVAVYRPLPFWVRFYIYGMQGLLDEVVFTAVFDHVFEAEGNLQLKGYSTIFSFFIYGGGSFVVERLYVFLYLKRGTRWCFRIPLYLLVIYTFEFAFGLILRQFNACSWDYSHYPLNVMGLVTLIYAPIWCVMLTLQEIIPDFLLSLRIATNDYHSGRIDNTYQKHIKMQQTEEHVDNTQRTDIELTRSKLC